MRAFLEAWGSQSDRGGGSSPLKEREVGQL